MHIFYQPDLTSDSIILSEEESKHCTRVLRLKQNDIVYLADGIGTQATSYIVSDNPKKTELLIKERINHTSNRNYSLSIAIAPTKNFDRIEWFIEKATECGIDEILFIETTNSERTKINLERSNKVAISAMKQSKQWWLPKIHSLINLDEYLKNRSNTNSLNLIAWCPENGQTLSHQLLQNANANSIHIMIGPEGDFTKNEIELAIQKGFIPVSLGTSILRTETAGLFACMAIKALKDFH